MYSSTRERAQYRSVPSSNSTYTSDVPKNEKPRTTRDPGTLSISEAMG